MFVHMLKHFENENHILHNSLCESNSLIKKYKRRNRILCEEVNNLIKKIQSNKSVENEGNFLFEGQECLSRACLFVHTSLKVFNLCLWYLDSGCSRHMTRDKSLFKSLKEKSEACEKLKTFCKKLQNEKGVPIVKIRRNNGKEFENAKF